MVRLADSAAQRLEQKQAAGRRAAWSPRAGGGAGRVEEDAGAGAGHGGREQ